RGAARVRQRLSRLAQHAVALGVATRIVHLLEAVEVEERDAHPSAVAAAALQLAGQALVELAVVAQPGERVARGELLLSLVEAGVAERDRGLGGEGLDHVEIARQEGAGVRGQRDEDPERLAPIRERSN